MKIKIVIPIFCIIFCGAFMQPSVGQSAIYQAKVMPMQGRQNSVQAPAKLNPVARAISKTGAKLGISSQGRLMPKAEQSQAPTMLQQGALKLKNALDLYISQPLARALGYSGHNNNLGVVDLVAGTSGMSYVKNSEHSVQQPVNSAAKNIAPGAFGMQIQVLERGKGSVQKLDIPEQNLQVSDIIAPGLQGEQGNADLLVVPSSFVQEGTNMPSMRTPGIPAKIKVGNSRSQGMVSSIDQALEGGSLEGLFEPELVNQQESALTFKDVNQLLAQPVRVKQVGELSVQSDALESADLPVIAIGEKPVVASSAQTMISSMIAGESLSPALEVSLRRGDSVNGAGGSVPTILQKSRALNRAPLSTKPLVSSEVALRRVNALRQQDMRASNAVSEASKAPSLAGKNPMNAVKQTSEQALPLVQNLRVGDVGYVKARVAEINAQGKQQALWPRQA